MLGTFTRESPFLARKKLLNDGKHLQSSRLSKTSSGIHRLLNQSISATIYLYFQRRSVESAMAEWKEWPNGKAKQETSVAHCSRVFCANISSHTISDKVVHSMYNSVPFNQTQMCILGILHLHGNLRMAIQKWIL